MVAQAGCSVAFGRAGRVLYPGNAAREKDQRDRRVHSVCSVRSVPFPSPTQKKGTPRVLSRCVPFRKRTGSELLSRTLECSIIAAEALHDRVRDGNGCYVLAMATSPKRWLHRKLLDLRLSNGFSARAFALCVFGRQDSVSFRLSPERTDVLSPSRSGESAVKPHG